ncbi:MAG: drug/metabolite transporter (DMT)-like permease [Granulosicoccus sp.]
MILTTVAAWSFVIIWSTGFIVARQIAGDADPHLFLTARFAIVALLFALFCRISRADWPDTPSTFRLIGIGALLSGLYLGPGFWAVGQGLQPGVMALTGTLQPPLTALLAWRFLQEEPSRWTFAGLFTGMIGVAMAVSPTLHGDTASGVKALPLIVLLAAVVSILSVTAGTLLQRSSVSKVSIAPACALQNVGGFLVVAILAIALGESRLPMDAKTLAALTYAVIVLSIGGFTLLIWLVRTGGATRSSSLMFLAPPLASIIAWHLYDDQLTPIQIAGFIVTLAGVWLARKQGSPSL